MQIPKISSEAARVNARFTQKDAAKALGISVATLRNYESGKTTPDWNLVRRIEKLYKYPVDYIFLP